VPLLVVVVLLLLPQPAATRAVSPIAAIVIRTFTRLPPVGYRLVVGVG
jgi:hypothetical protein